jgi:hypothetical protein
VEDPGTYRPLVVGLVLVGVLIVAVAILSMQGSPSNGAGASATATEQQTGDVGAQPPVVEQPTHEKQTHDAQQKEEAQKQEAHRMQMEAENLQLETEKGLCAPDADPTYRTSHCVTVTILQAHVVNITHTDENGYEHTLRNGLQRLTVSMELPKTGRGLFELYGQLFNGDVATADILCLLRCPELDVGTRHIMGIATIHVNDLRLPYLSIGNNKWQVLELCRDTIQDRCTELSTPYAGP